MTASLTLIRPGPEGLEIFLTRRRVDRSFLPGFSAFFAGKIEAEDRQGGGDQETIARRAALREMGEEAGISVSSDWLPRLHAFGWWRAPHWMHPYLTAFFGLLLTAAEGSALENLAATLDPREFSGGGWMPATEVLRRWRHPAAGELLLLTEPLVTIIEALAKDQRLPEVPVLGDAPETPGTALSLEFSDGITMLPLRSPTLPPATHTNAVILGRRRLLIVDPGAASDEAMAPLMEHLRHRLAAGACLEGIFLTHHHVDHISGVAPLLREFAVPVLAHARTLDLLPTRPPTARELRDDEPLPHVDLTAVTCLHTPGHAPGHLALHLPDRGLLIAGDLVAAEGTIIIDPPQGHMGSYLSSLRRARALRPQAILPAHGQLIADADATLKRYLDHRLHREALVAAALESRGFASPEELIPLVYPEIPRAVWPLACRSLLAHLLHLEEQGRATRAGADEVFVCPA